MGPPRRSGPIIDSSSRTGDQYQSIRNGENEVTGAVLDDVVTELLVEVSAGAAFEGAGMAITIAAATNVEAMIFFTCSS
ncbi:hypothetical protein BHE97_05360 [Aeromicrobium sp. PE09-221]|nr:hypothetical protein BHE97_05360 [Aeromicrobium sp. PE09-221]